MMFAIKLIGRLVVATGTVELEKAEERQVLEGHLDAVMDELFDLSAIDPRIDLDLTDNTIEMHVCIDSRNPIEAMTGASGLLRSAIHAAGGLTPDWPSPPDEAWSVQLVSATSKLVTEQADDTTGDLQPA